MWHSRLRLYQHPLPTPPLLNRIDAPPFALGLSGRSRYLLWDYFGLRCSLPLEPVETRWSRFPRAISKFSPPQGATCSQSWINNVASRPATLSRAPSLTANDGIPGITVKTKQKKTGPEGPKQGRLRVCGCVVCVHAWVQARQPLVVPRGCKSVSAVIDYMFIGFVPIHVASM